ncbi:G patch domain and ankyrin repeat-containing protein 1-like [Antedon mediterranea]|uniref:G patch domain and ankyrin repeat-containing protein 1-like n=1 Tax=Antedon mediterranea TaxID=105859 RepID=UPI003AF77BEC
MAFYKKQILFQKSKRNRDCSTEIYTETSRSSAELNTSEGNAVKEFYECVIKTEANISECSTSTSSCSEVKPIKNVNLKRKRKNKKRLTRQNTVNSFLKAATDGDIKTVEEFISQNCDINMKDAFGWTALMCACSSRQVKIVECLLSHGAEWIGIKDKSGTDAMSLAQQTGQMQIVNLLADRDRYWATLRNKNGESANIEPFYCNSCSTSIEASTSKEHMCSTIHQFCSQHKKQSTMYYLTENNKGYQMMLKDGWDSESGLGPDGSGMKFPVKTTLKRDRECLGSGSTESRPRITHFKPFDTAAIKRPRNDRTESNKRQSTKEIGVTKAKKSRNWEIEYRQSWNTEPN